jgi:hypothetical protein
VLAAEGGGVAAAAGRERAAEEGVGGVGDGLWKGEVRPAGGATQGVSLKVGDGGRTADLAYARLCDYAGPELVGEGDIEQVEALDTGGKERG